MPPKASANEVLGKNLDGFELRVGYWAELRHGLMGTFPALYAGTEEIVACLSEDLMKKVLGTMDERPCRINKILLLVNTKEQYGFNVSNLMNGDEYRSGMGSIPILTEETFTMQMTGHGFAWARGLVG